MEKSFQPYDYILDKPRKRLELLELGGDDEGADMPVVVDAFLSSVVEAYGMVGEMTSSDKQQVSSRLAAVKEQSVQCNHEVVGGSFNSEKWRCIAKEVMKNIIKTVEETRQTQMLRQVQLCEHNLDGILKCEFVEIIVTEFKRLLMNTSRLLEYVFKYMSWGTLKGQKTQNILMLCASQLQKLFPLLLRALEAASDSIQDCAEAKKHVVQRMTICLSKMKSAIKGEISEGEDESDDLGGGLFIEHMDQALSFLAIFDSTNRHHDLSDQWRSSVESVLQHAMSIAQIASQLDFKMIHASGEKVLRECENLEQECKSPTSNVAVRKLHAASLSNALEELEQRVCASVLKMYLQVFSDPLAPLQSLCHLCCSKHLLETLKSAADLSDAICAFDSHTDRILQVAVFAIACSEDKNRVLGIRSCLASLETLEAHLVPALSTLYVKQTPKDHILASLLVEHWKSEVELLRELIDGIVDPAALAQVTHNVIWTPTAIIKKSIMGKRVLGQNELTRLVKSIVSNAEVLSHQLQASTEELHLSQHPSAWKALKELSLAVKEGKAVLQRIQGPDPSLSLDRILKRCELLVSCVGNIQPLLEEIDNPEPKELCPQFAECTLAPQMKLKTTVEASSKKNKSLNKKLVLLGLPPDAEIEIDTTDSTSPCDLMQSVLDKTSAQPRFMTSFLYNEKKSFQKASITPRCHLISHIFSRKVAEHQQSVLQQTFSLDVPKLAVLSETLRCQNNSIMQTPSSSCFESGNVRNELEQNATSHISTPERMHDLFQVENRIEAMKVNAQCYTNSPFIGHSQ